MTSLILLIIEEAIKLEPSIVGQLQFLFNGQPVTPEMVAALRAKIAAEKLSDLSPNN